ncbi:unnamed protein product [Camellia sinensis]
MGFMNLICPNSPYISTVLGFGINIMTLVMITVLGITKRTAGGTGRIYFLEKVFLRAIPALRAFVAFFDMALGLKEALNGYNSPYHDWLFRGSQCLIWVTILLISNCNNWFATLCNRILCFWWVMKPLLGIPFLQTAFSSQEALRCLKESCVLSVDILFGICINIIRIKRTSPTSRKYSSVDEPLLSCGMDIEEGRFKDSKAIGHGVWHLMTFKSINSVMEQGVIKQLDFEDLLQLPNDMDPSSSLNTLLSSWQTQQRNNCSHPSFFRAIFTAYGWPYLRLGALKVLNDCMGFVGPLLLNQLLQFLQQGVMVQFKKAKKGSQHLDGYILAISLGLTSVLKSFLDTQYTFHLSKLKLKMRSSIMTVIYRKGDQKMERKQGFFSALKDEVGRGLSPGRSRGRSPSRSVSPGSGLLRRRRPAAGHHVAGPDVFISRSESLRPAEALSPLMEGPDPDESDGGDSRMERWGHWMKGQLGLCLSTVRSEVAAQCFGCASGSGAPCGGQKLQNAVVNAYAMGKCLCVSLAERSKFSEGEIQTFMSIDADRTVNLFSSLHDMWRVKYAFLSGIAITILLIPEIRRTGEILTSMRTLKMYAWELLFTSWLTETRSSEVKHLSTRKYLDAWCVFFWAATPTLFSLFTFGLYSLMGNQLDAATVFTCLALFNSLISPLNSFPWVINGLIDAIISTKRLSRFLSCSENEPDLGQTGKSPPSSCSEDQSDMAIVIRDACCTWSTNDEQERDMILHHVTLHLPKGSLVAVIGEVGSGKSSLLNLILGEMRLINGSIHSSGSIAYVPQVPWILSGTLRDNILFGKDYDPRRYSDVLQACALKFDISQMVGGDMTYIGEKGVNLSGGQRARLALARAIYYGSDIIMLDDVLSAVDAQVACWILYEAILGPLMSQQTRILCTHNVQAISSADIIVVMDKGHVNWAGSSADLSISSLAFSSLKEFNISSQFQTIERSGNTSTETKENVISESDCIHVSEGEEQVIEGEQRKEGRVELNVCKHYAAFAGWTITIVTCLSAILMQASRNGNDLWLSYWVDTTGSDKKGYPTSFYLDGGCRRRTCRGREKRDSKLVVLCIFSAANSVLTLTRAFSFAFGGLRAAIQVHDRLLNKLMDAPINFFDQTPSGRILNRFSSDLYTIDDALPFILNSLLANFVGLLGIAIVLSYVQVMFLLLLLPFWYIYSKLQKSTSRELRRLDSVSRSPIYASFTETLDGSSTIRAFKSE